MTHTFIPVISVLKTQRQENHEFAVSLHHRARPCLKNLKARKQKTQQNKTKKRYQGQIDDLFLNRQISHGSLSGRALWLLPSWNFSDANNINMWLAMMVPTECIGELSLRPQ